MFKLLYKMSIKVKFHLLFWPLTLPAFDDDLHLEIWFTAMFLKFQLKYNVKYTRKYCTIELKYEHTKNKTVPQFHFRAFSAQISIFNSFSSIFRPHDDDDDDARKNEIHTLLSERQTFTLILLICFVSFHTTLRHRTIDKRVRSDKTFSFYNIFYERHENR